MVRVCCCHRTLQRRAVLTAWIALIAFTAIFAAGPARAADWLDDLPLRGSLFGTPVDWDGIYIGGSIGVANSDTDYSNSTHDFIDYSLRETTLRSQNAPQDWNVLQSDIERGRSYGGFIGYSMTWDQVIISAELAYNKVTGLDSSATGSIVRTVSNSNGTDTVTISATNSLKLNDYGTVRARVGYAFGQFLPYGYLGVAVGRFDYSSNIYLNVTGADNGTFTQDESQTDAILAGFTGGLGMDVALAPNVFLRGEWEYIAFAQFKGIRANTNTARAGIAVRF
jgi:opacity protein-like surface antigen